MTLPEALVKIVEIVVPAAVMIIFLLAVFGNPFRRD